MKLKFVIVIISLLFSFQAAQAKFDLKDSVVLITGASGDIGLHTAERFLQEGAYVIAQYHSHPERLQPLVAKYPSHFKMIESNFKDPLNAEKTWEQALTWKKHIDVVVNSAGINKEAKNAQDIYPVMAETMAINYFAPVILCNLALAHFKKQNIPGVIINLGSRASFRGMPTGLYHYADSKAALTRYTQQIARDNVEHGITAVIIAPGPVEGQMLDRLDSAAREKCLASLPSKKPVKLDEISNVVLFYASHQAPSGTGGVFDLMGASWFH